MPTPPAPSLSTLLTAEARQGTEELLLAVPPGYTREQLGLLVGIANECGVSVRGLVDAGVAAVATVAPAPCLLHLDLQLHQASATLLEASRAEGTLRRTRYELLPGVGVLALRQVMAYHVVPGMFTSDFLTGVDVNYTTLKGTSLNVDGTDGLRVDDATIVTPDLGASNGVVNIIDRVLTPR